MRHQKASSRFLSRTTIEPSVRIRGPNCEGTKNYPTDGFRHSLFELPISSNRPEASQEIKVKLNESRQLKFYQVK